MSTHSPLSAKVATTTGFRALWVSGFELSAIHAVPDASILTPSSILDLTRSVAEAVSVPLIVDLDTGFGNAVNVAYAVPRFAAAGASAVVLEDKAFPKDSSLRPGGRQVLVSTEEFQGKIRAAKAAATTSSSSSSSSSGSSLLVIARTEALIAGLGQNEALRRGEAYVDAGADAVLIHSKQRTPDEILSFCHAWAGRKPLVIVPTSYPALSFAEVAALGKVGMMICGNHAVRAAVAGMRGAFRRILEDGGLAGVEGQIAGVEDVFELQGDREMREIERLYLR